MAIGQLNFDDLGLQHDLTLDHHLHGLQKLGDTAQFRGQCAYHDHAGLGAHYNVAPPFFTDDGSQCGIYLGPEIVI